MCFCSVGFVRIVNDRGGVGTADDRCVGGMTQQCTVMRWDEVAAEFLGIPGFRVPYNDLQAFVRPPYVKPEDEVSCQWQEAGAYHEHKHRW